MNNYSGKTKSKKKTFNPDNSRSAIAETESQTYERIRNQISLAMDKHGTGNISSLMDEISITTSGQIVIDAYIAACLRKRTNIAGAQMEIRLMMLPILVQLPEDAETPRLVDKNTACKIQRIVLSSLENSGRGGDVIIPTDRLLSLAEFDSENPRDLYDILCGVAECLASNSTKELNRYVVLASEESTTKDDLTYSHQGEQTVARLYPLIHVSALTARQDDLAIDERSLAEIASLLSICDANLPHAVSGLKEDRRILTKVTALAIMEPDAADREIRSKMQFGRLVTNAQSLVDAAQPCTSEATISFDTITESLKISLQIHLESDIKREIDFEVNLGNSVESHRYVESMRKSLRGVGVCSVSVQMDEQIITLPLSGSLH